ncbi:putative Late nodulin [Medicago truncatula]|uniref:Nodule Cysteine-Rich (NCR) secreted peptide n=1 Tax=Medicago truncatula TaxID=3880 RepID=G7KEA5_MEDTR|nr:Nodule Cysteine-Rich (NCR) secreted peptide [Medicago truncatula]RHN56592.1 putative Late nodulin [Medicago truncatula]
MTETLKFVVTKKKTLKFVYAMILFLSFFLIASEVGGSHFGCETDADCPRSTDKNFFLRCINKKCEWAAKRH